MSHYPAPVLIVDDRPADLAAMETALSELGQPIVRASSGQQALEILLRQDFAVILLDVRMPEMDGFETAQFIRRGKRSKFTPIIFVTAGDELSGKALQGYSAGAVDCIQKPIHTEILRSKVRVFVELYQKGRELASKADALARTNQELQTASRNLEVFTYAMAHELRSPLRAMSGFSQILREEYAQRPFDATGQDYARRIERGAQRMDSLIRDLLTYCNVARSSSELGPVDPGEVLREALSALLPSLGERAADVSIEGAFPLVVGNRSLLMLALSGLLSNAFKFVAAGVRPKVQVGHERRNDQVRIWVEDNGVGIHPDHYQRIFGVFERLNVWPEVGGTGIGLPIAKAAVERMGGRVGLESHPGRGSRFWIDLAPSPVPLGSAETSARADRRRAAERS